MRAAAADELETALKSYGGTVRAETEERLPAPRSPAARSSSSHLETRTDRRHPRPVHRSPEGRSTFPILCLGATRRGGCTRLLGDRSTEGNSSLGIRRSSEAGLERRCSRTGGASGEQVTQRRSRSSMSCTADRVLPLLAARWSANAQDAEDLTNQTFTRMLESHRSLRIPGRARSPPGSSASPKTWRSTTFRAVAPTELPDPEDRAGRSAEEEAIASFGQFGACGR